MLEHFAKDFLVHIKDKSFVDFFQANQTRRLGFFYLTATELL
jgi:hypothetical protein